MLKKQQVKAMSTRELQALASLAKQDFDEESSSEDGDLIEYQRVVVEKVPAQIEGLYQHVSASTIGKEQFGDRVLNSEQLASIVKSKLLKSATTLDLSKQKNLTNQHVLDLANNRHSSRLENIYLSNCRQIGDEALNAILDSRYIGSVRTTPKSNGRYALAGTYVFVRIDGTVISRELREQRWEKRPFEITYERTSPHDRYYSPDHNGVKTLELCY